MASQHLTNTQHTSTPHLDGYLKGIRDEFERLNHELDETRKQRDEYITKYKIQDKELQELRQSISSRENSTVCQRGQVIVPANACEVSNDNPLLISPISSSSEYCLPLDEEYAASDDAKEIDHFEGERNQEDGQDEVATVTAAPWYPAWDFVSNETTTAKLNLNLVHKLKQEGTTWVNFSIDGKYLAIASNRGVVSIFDSKTGERTMHDIVKNLYHTKKALPVYTCVEFSPNGKFIATGEENGSVRIWIISQRRVRNTFRHESGYSLHSLNFSPDGRCIVTCANDDRVIIWWLRDGSSRVLTASKILTASRFYPRSVRFSQDGRYIASGDFHGNIQIWNVRLGNLVARWKGHSELVASLAFTPDGKRLLSGSWDGQIIQWDVSSLRSLGLADPPISCMIEISRLIGHTNYISTVSISPDSKWIVSSSWDSTTRIWNAHEATVHCILHCFDRVTSADFSLVGNYLAIGGDFNDVAIWNYVNP